MVKWILSLILILAPIGNIHAIDSELYCLTKNVYHEARGEPRQGMLAVALVTLNRVDDKRFPSSICGVVYQKNQFSWTAKPIRVKINDKHWRKAFEASLEAYMDRNILGKFKATHFHNTFVSPRWKLRKVAQIGNHIFYV